MDLTVFIPFFGGVSEAAPSAAANRKGYLQKTLDSVAEDLLPDFIVVGVANEEDKKTVLSLGHEVSVVEFYDIDPIWLPYELALWGQKNVITEYIYFTEADQVVHLNFNFLRLVKDSVFLAPHRLEKLGERGQGAHRGLVVTYQGEKYVLPNGEPQGGETYHPEKFVWGYGGATLMHYDFFTTIPYHKDLNLRVECISGIDAYDKGHCLKTSNWEDFYVIHLSGEEYHNKLQ